MASSAAVEADLDDVKGFQDYLAVLKRRKWQFALPAATLFVIGALAAFLWPPVYQSSARILIEAPGVPRNLVNSTVGSFAAERIHVITQRIMTTTNLVKIIDKYDLYAEKRERVPMGVIVGEMRRLMGLEMIDADVVDPRSGRAQKATIAFNVTFDHRRPAIAQRVLNEIVSLYLAENLRARLAKAADTTEFLAGEVARYYDLVNGLEENLAQFKKRYAGALPDEFGINLQLVERTDRELFEVRRQLQSLEERRIYLEPQLTQLNPYVQVQVSGTVRLSPAERLRALQDEFVSVSGVYGPEHPDVRRLAREIEALGKEVGVQGDAEELERRREDILAELTAARERYSDAHPDVKRLERQLESVLAALASVDPEPVDPRQPDNPAYIQIAVQLEAVRSEVRSLQEKRAALEQRFEVFEKRISESPQIEKKYLLLRRNYENAIATYREVKAKQTVAEMGESLEEKRKGERFSLIEPPTMPSKPIKPNRLGILLFGLVFSLAAGTGTAALFEALDHSVYGQRQLRAVIGAPPLVVVPFIKNRADVQRARNRRILWPLATFLCLGLGLFLINEYFLPLDAIWDKAERRMELLLMEIGIV